MRAFCTLKIQPRIALILPLLLLYCAVALPARADTTWQEREVANLIRSHQGQGRPFMVEHPILTSVAQSRARDMANRGYFGHTNPDGIGPNALVSAAGFHLPDWYDHSLAGNNIESIAAGYTSPPAVVNAWIASPGHRTHVLAEDVFFQEQTYYGVGYVYAPGSPYLHYWVFLSAPVSLSTPIQGPVLAVGTMSGPPLVRHLNAVNGEPVFEFYSNAPSFEGGVRVAIGDVNGDGFSDIITAPGPGARPRVKIFSGQTGARLPGRIGSFLAYDSRFRGGVNVASGDVNGDGFDDIITGAGRGGRPHVRVFSGRTGAQFPRPIGSFLAYDSRFRGGVNVASGDVDGDGIDDIVTGPGRGGRPHARVFSGRTGAQLPRPIGSFLAYGPRFRGGVNVASGDVNGDGSADIITGPGQGGRPHVRVFSGRTGAQFPRPVGSFLAYGSRFRGGVNVASGDVNGDGSADIITGPGQAGRPRVQSFSGANGNRLSLPTGSFLPYSPSFRGGVYVSVSD